MLLLKKCEEEPSFFERLYLTRIKSPRQISPFRLNLNLKPLYSIRGGSTERAEPLIKKPTVVVLRLKPLYKWNVCNQFTFVLSETLSQVFLKTIVGANFFF